MVLDLTPQFQWREGTHGASLRWHIWVEDSEGQHLYHNEVWALTRKMMREPQHRIAFTIPIFEPLPSQYYIRCAGALCWNALGGWVLGGDVERVREGVRKGASHSHASPGRLSVRAGTNTEVGLGTSTSFLGLHVIEASFCGLSCHPQLLPFSCFLLFRVIHAA